MSRLLVFLAFVFGPAALAQPALPTGAWTGTLQWRDAEPVALDGTLEECAEGLKLALASGGGAYQADEVLRLDAEAEAPALRFRLANTQRRYDLACAAERQADGTFAGRCQTDEGVWARLELQPPAQSLIGCSE